VRLGANAVINTGKRGAILLDVDYRFGNDNQRRNVHFETGMLYNIAEWFKAGAVLRISGGQEVTGWEVEFRPRVFGTFFWAWNHFSLGNRNQFEYRLQSSSLERDYWRYRNRTRFGFPFEALGQEFVPYFADEIFVDMNRGSFERNRVIIGIDFTFAKHLGMDVFYFWENMRNDPSRVNTSVFGAKLKVVY